MALAGGDSGAVILPGKPEESLLLTAVRYTDSSLEMPPKEKLSKRQVELIAEWLAMGAPWPEDAGKGVAPVSAKREAFEITDEDRDYWAYRPVVAPPVPVFSAGAAVANPIDAFILDKLRGEGIRHNGRASKRVLIRRLRFDLTGLPPTMQEIEAFESDASSRAYENLIDRLLASPRYGERWGRHWLDVVRYAQSNGYERDDEKLLAWKYRDYVIAAFNSDRPYDRFVLEQLAGDELPDGGAEGLIATGFYRLGVWDDEPDDARAAYYEELDDIMRSTGETFLGVTVGCSRCHDHMFDPFSQRDYYELLAVFHSIRGFEKPVLSPGSATHAPLGEDSAVKAFQAENAAKLKPVREELANLRNTEKRSDLQDSRIRELENRERQILGESGPFEYALAVREQPGEAKETRILIRGNAGRPGEKVEPRLPEVFGGGALAGQRRAGPAPSSGRRLEFARWVASPENPLTARVMVNRVWQHHFGEGLVNTPNDFGRAGGGVSHPELLDWLAARFIADGWSIKKLHKVILLSETWQRASTPDAAAEAADPGNRLLWRQNLRRLEAEAIRDAMLRVTGELNDTMGGRGVFVNLDREVVAGGSRPGRGWDFSPPGERHRRSAYLFVKRTMGAPFMELFDYANTEGPVGRRPVTTVAPQALALLNSEFVDERARAAVAELRTENAREATLELYRRILARAAEPEEIDAGSAYLERQLGQRSARASQLRFTPDVPAALNDEYWAKLPGGRFLRAPAGWIVHKGSWGSGYERIILVQPDRGPFALLTKARFRDGRITGRLRLDATTSHAGFILRADAAGELFFGADLLIEPRENRVSLRRLDGEKIGKVVQAELSLPSGAWIDFVVEQKGARIAVSFNGDSKPALVAEDPGLTAGNGSFGVRAWGGGLTLDDLAIEANGSVIRPHELDFENTPHLAAQQKPRLTPTGWKAYGGAWSVAPPDGLKIGPGLGHKILWEDFGPLGDGVVSMDLRLTPGGAGIAGFILRVNDPAVGADNWIGYEVSVNLGSQGVFIGTHNHSWTLQASAPAKIEPVRWHRLEARLDGQRMRVFLDGAEKPLLDFEQPVALQPGLVGIRTWGPAVEYRNITARSGDRVATWAPKVEDVKDAPWLVVKRDLRKQAFQRAAADLASALFNLNEFVYVD